MRLLLRTDFYVKRHAEIVQTALTLLEFLENGSIDLLQDSQEGLAKEMVGKLCVLFGIGKCAKTGGKSVGASEDLRVRCHEPLVLLRHCVRSPRTSGVEPDRDPEQDALRRADGLDSAAAACYSYYGCTLLLP